jgi:hypothetical protein
MAHSAYPTAAQIESFIRALGILEDDDVTALLENLDLSSIADAAKAAWEADTGWKPFLRDATPVSRRFDAPGPNRGRMTRGGAQRLELDAGLLQITAFVTGYSASLVEPDAGDALVVEDDYWLWPPNAALEDRPYTAIEFAGYQWGIPQSVRVTGYWGYSANIPHDAWEAILRQAGLLAYSELTLQVTGAMAGWSEADVKEQYDLSPLELHRKAWEMQWDRAVNRYRRPYL